MMGSRFSIVFLSFFVASNLIAQSIVPASIFGNNMVLQQGINVPVWGVSEPNAEVAVSVAGTFQKTNANQDGKWMVKLSTLQAGGPFEMRISSAKESLVFSSVFVGEVWLASGQSNMQFKLSEANNAAREIADAQYPAIHFFTVEQNISSKPLNKVKGEWLKCNPENAKKFSAAAYFFARELHKEKNVPVGVISASWGATPVEAWTSGESLINHPDFKDSVTRYQKMQEDWERLYRDFKDEVEAIRSLNNGTKPPAPPAQKNYPTALYNSMIAPLVPYGIKGVIWYQGENNAARATQYRSLFPLFINDWRSKFQNDSLPVIFVQLANFKSKNPEPVFKDDWASLREAQAMALQLPNTGMAVTIDIGDAKNIHPTNKQDVGKRLFLAANHVAYKSMNVYSGPQYVSMNIKDATVEISFMHVGKGLQSKGSTLSGFAVAGADKKFYWADAKIEDDKIVLNSSQVANPIAVRYAWASNPDAGLYNIEGLPAVPFRTDNW